MIKIRRSNERGRTQIDWLDSYHTFSFDTYQDPQWENFRALRVINEDFVKPGAGFHPHSHRDMEIITYILSGALEHKDSMGNGSVIRSGEVQRMSAGTGVTHSEFNPSGKEAVHLLQIWILPEKKGITPGYEQKKFSESDQHGKLCLIAAERPEKNSLKIHQDVKLYVSRLRPKERLDYSFASGRSGWVQLAQGELEINGKILKAGDGAGISGEKSAAFTSLKTSEFLLFDLN